MAPTQLTLVVPGLLGPFPRDGEPLPDPPVLLRLLRNAKVMPGAPDPVAWLCNRFGITREWECDWPLAPLLAELELEEAGQDYWLRADPVHLRADRSRLVLFGPEVLAIHQEEADALAESFNALYQPDGLQLYTPTPNRWYLRLAHAPSLSTTPLPDVIGRDIDRHLPRGEDAAPWHARLNEIQMLFHAHAVNERRVGPPLTEIVDIYTGNPDGLIAWVKAPGKKRAGYPEMPPISMQESQYRAVADYVLDEVFAEDVEAVEEPAAG